MQPELISTFEAYGNCVDQRVHGAEEAAKYGAVGVWVRSMSLRLDDLPHTGAMRYGDLKENEKIPAAAISTNAANLLSTMLKLTPDLQVYFKQSCEYKGIVNSYNVIGEITGTENFELLVIRELSGGIYFGEHSRPTGNTARDVAEYDRTTIAHIAKFAFESAMKRDKKLTSVDKANVLEVSALWRQVVEEEKENFPDVELEHLYVDNCAMQLVRRPTTFDVIVTGNIFGDILSDEAGVVVGSLGMLPSASIGDKYALYEPVHGSAPDIAGKGIANPIATILSAAMMLKYSFGMDKAHDLIEKSIEETLNQGYRTPDIWSEDTIKVGTKEITDKILENIERFKGEYL